MGDLRTAPDPQIAAQQQIGARLFYAVSAVKLVDEAPCTVLVHVGRYRRSRYNAGMSGTGILPFASGEEPFNRLVK